MAHPLPGLKVHDIWRIVPVLVLLLALFATPVFRFLDEPGTPGTPGTPGEGGRSQTIDGLRAFLALGVFFAHASGYYAYMTTGWWGPGPSLFFNQLGDVGVFLFFIITSFLFWGKAIGAGGRVRSAADYRRYLSSLYVARLFRIAPLYYFVIATMLVDTLAGTGLHLVVSPLRFVKDIAHWLPLGLGANVRINGSDTPPVTAGMVWTLAWEWYFYFSLAVLSLLAFSRRLRIALPLVSLVVALVAALHWQLEQGLFVALFSLGMIFAAALASGRPLPSLPEPLASIVAAALIVLAYSGVGGAHSGLQLACIAAFFYLVMNGCSLFGLLMTQGAQRLGTISYSIYLMHGLCLHVVFGLAPVRAFAFASVAQYWFVVLLAGVATTCVASLTFFFIEAPGIRAGRHVLGKIRTARAGREAPQPTPAAT